MSTFKNILIAVLTVIVAIAAYRITAQGLNTFLLLTSGFYRFSGARGMLYFLITPSCMMGLMAAWVFLYVIRAPKNVFLITLGGLITYASIYVGLWMGIDFVWGLESRLLMAWTDWITRGVYGIPLIASLLVIALIRFFSLDDYLYLDIFPLPAYILKPVPALLILATGATALLISGFLLPLSVCGPTVMGAITMGLYYLLARVEQLHVGPGESRQVGALVYGAAVVLVFSYFASFVLRFFPILGILVVPGCLLAGFLTYRKLVAPPGSVLLA
jgi:hypothetical protein